MSSTFSPRLPPARQAARCTTARAEPASHDAISMARHTTQARPQRPPERRTCLRAPVHSSAAIARREGPGACVWVAGRGGGTGSDDGEGRGEAGPVMSSGAKVARRHAPPGRSASPARQRVSPHLSHGPRPDLLLPLSFLHNKQTASALLTHNTTTHYHSPI